MRHRATALKIAIGPALLALAGCVPPDSSRQLVSENPFGGPAVTPPPSRSSFPPASTEAGSRADSMLRKIIAANPQMGIKPVIVTIGASDPEIFHRGTAEIDITEGLVKQCVTDGPLAAVLCSELGKMISERQAMAPHLRGSQNPEPAEDVRISGDPGADMTRQAELAKYYESDRRRRMSSAPDLPPDPKALARDYLIKAGYPPAELEGVASLLKAASGNCKFEKQLTSPGPARPWTQ